MTKPWRVLPLAVRSMSTKPSGCFCRIPFFRYSFMLALMAAMRSGSSGLPRYASGRIRSSVEGASPMIRRASSQYSFWEVNWSQATTAHFFISVPWGGSITSGTRTPIELLYF